MKSKSSAARPKVALQSLARQSETKEERRLRYVLAEKNAKAVLKRGDRIRITRCPGVKRTVTFEGWDGHWAVSRSGINDIGPSTIDRVNGRPVDFCLPSAERTDAKGVR